MDSLQSQSIVEADSSSLLQYAAFLCLLLALFLIRKYLYKLDIYLARKLPDNPSYTGKPWHVTWSFILGIVFMLTQLMGNGVAGSFDTIKPGIFLSNPHPWQWFWFILFLAELILMIRVIFQGIKHFGLSMGLIRSLIITILMCIYFLSGMYMSLFFVGIVAIYVIYRIFKLFYGRKKGLLTS